MPDLFGLDIAKVVNDAISSAGGVRPGVLTHFNPPFERDPDNPTSGVDATLTTHDIRGFVDRKEVRRPGQVGAMYESVVSILGASINPKTIPKVNDTVVMDGATYKLVELAKLDPAAALYEFKAET